MPSLLDNFKQLNHQIQTLFLWDYSRLDRLPTIPTLINSTVDKTKLEAFVTQFCIKLQQNADHFIYSRQSIKQNQLSYVIFCLEGDAFLQIKPYVFWNGINLSDIATLEALLKTQFSDVDPVGTAKHKLCRLYQVNRDLKMFLNTFFVLAKKTKLDDSQTMDLLYKMSQT